ncbi:MFS transporter, partial [Micromonospora chersina]
SALGLAAMTAVASAAGADQLGDLPALTDGYSTAFLAAGITAAAGAVIAGITLRGARRQPVADAETVTVG